MILRNPYDDQDSESEQHMMIEINLIHDPFLDMNLALRLDKPTSM